MTDFCVISPSAYLSLFASNRPTHLLLADLLLEDPVYRRWYQRERTANPQSYFIVDNSAYERYKRGLPMLTAEALIEACQLVHADCAVLPDYPNEDPEKTKEAAKEWAPLFCENEIETMFVPQAEIGDVDGLIDSFLWADSNPHISRVALSIISAPNAFEVEDSASPTARMQRYLSRFHFMNELNTFGFFELDIAQNMHFLGMTEGPNEIVLMQPYLEFIASWDSSSPVWHGMMGINYDKSPTGLRNGKATTPVNFKHDNASVIQLTVAAENVAYVDRLIRVNQEESDD